MLRSILYVFAFTVPLLVPQSPHIGYGVDRVFALTDSLSLPHIETAIADAAVTDNAPPVRLVIPSIRLDASVIPVGVNSKGEMDVPSGSTDLIGWYESGTVPGQFGSAVLDAHVFAGFSDLRYVKIGDDIQVVNADGKTLHFTVRDSRVFTLSELTPGMLFKGNGRLLNLITCAGRLVADGSTYDHRLVVFAELVE
ncbi:MAG: class F sortase [Candidatus Paceibacterota bacterium]